MWKSSDWNVIFLLIGMMTISNLIRPSGFFEYIAIKSAKIGRGEPLRIMMVFAVVSGLLSAFLDNVTTVLLVVIKVVFGPKLRTTEEFRQRVLAMDE